MSLALVTGKPGTGKSFTLVGRWIIRTVRDHLHELGTPNQRLIYSNVTGLKPLYISLILGDEYPPEKIEKMLVEVPPPENVGEANKVIMSMPPRAVLVLDEAQKYWNNRNFKSLENQEILKYFQEHRRRGHDVILATQHFEQVDIGIRRLAEVHYELKRLKRLGFANQIRANVYDQGETMDCKPDGKQIWKLRKDVFKCYDSYIGGATKEFGFKVPNILFSSPKLVFLMFMVLGGVLWVVFGRGGKAVTGKVLQDKMQKEQAIQRKPLETYLGGNFTDYVCSSNYVYILRPDEKIDSLSTARVPYFMCPFPDYVHSVNKKDATSNLKGVTEK